MSLYAFRPLMEMNVVSSRAALPILMYHSISDDSEPEQFTVLQNQHPPGVVRTTGALVE